MAEASVPSRYPVPSRPGTMRNRPAIVRKFVLFSPSVESWYSSFRGSIASPISAQVKLLAVGGNEVHRLCEQESFGCLLVFYFFSEAHQNSGLSHRATSISHPVPIVRKTAKKKRVVSSPSR